VALSVYIVKYIGMLIMVLPVYVVKCVGMLIVALPCYVVSNYTRFTYMIIFTLKLFQSSIQCI